MKESTTKTTTKKATTRKQKTENTVNQPLEITAMDVIDSDFFNPTGRECLKQQSAVIKRELLKGQQAFVKVGHALNTIACTYSEKYFKDLGYKNIYHYAEINFGIAKGTCSEFMRIAEQFCKYVDGKPLPELDEKYEKFSSSKLAIMITLSDEELKQCAPGMTVREIKKLKKSSRNKEIKNSEKSSVCEQTEKENIIEDDNFEISNVVISFRTLEEYNANIDKLDELITRCLKAGHTVKISETVPKVRTSEQ